MTDIIPADINDVWLQARRNHRMYSDTGDKEGDIRFLTLGLAGEAGEVANFVKKRWRDGEGHDEAIKLEIYDVCAYAFMLADTMGDTPADLIAGIAHKQQVFIDKMNIRRLIDEASQPELCDDCPPVGYPTDKTRCDPCPRRSALKARAAGEGE